MATGESIIHRLVIPEGPTVREIIDKINKEPLLEWNNINANSGRILMPSTYFYSYSDKREDTINNMRLNMSLALDEVMQNSQPILL